MNILTENGQILNWEHHRLMEVQQRIRHGVTRFEITAYHATTNQHAVVRTVNRQEFANKLVSEFFTALKTKKTVWDAFATEDVPPKAEPAPESVETPEAPDVPPQTA